MHARSATSKEPDMHSPATLELANHLVADAERRWLYGHPYRAEPGTSAFAGRPARAPRVRRSAAATTGVRRGARALFRRHGLAA
jgi:hypothetical protein